MTKSISPYARLVLRASPSECNTVQLFVSGSFRSRPKILRSPALTSPSSICAGIILAIGSHPQNALSAVHRRRFTWLAGYVPPCRIDKFDLDDPSLSIIKIEQARLVAEFIEATMKFSKNQLGQSYAGSLIGLHKFLTIAFLTSSSIERSSVSPAKLAIRSMSLRSPGPMRLGFPATPRQSQPSDQDRGLPSAFEPLQGRCRDGEARASTVRQYLGCAGIPRSRRSPRR